MCEICHKSPHDRRCPNAEPPDYPRCPVCGALPEMFFADNRERIVGCERCLHPREWWQIGGDNHGKI